MILRISYALLMPPTSRLRGLTLLFAVATLVTIAASSRPAQADPDPRQDRPGPDTPGYYLAAITADDVYVRSGPADSYYPFGKLRKGDVVKVIGEKYHWARVVTVGPAFKEFFGYVRYAKSDTGRFRLEANGARGRTYGRTDLLAPNLNTNFNPGDSWKRILALEADTVLTVLSTTESDREHVHRVALPPAAEGWISVSFLRPATAEESTTWKKATAGVTPAASPASAPRTGRTPGTAGNTTGNTSGRETTGGATPPRFGAGPDTGSRAGDVVPVRTGRDGGSAAVTPTPRSPVVGRDEPQVRPVTDPPAGAGRDTTTTTPPRAAPRETTTPPVTAPVTAPVTTPARTPFTTPRERPAPIEGPVAPAAGATPGANRSAVIGAPPTRRDAEAAPPEKGVRRRDVPAPAGDVYDVPSATFDELESMYAQLKLEPIEAAEVLPLRQLYLDLAGNAPNATTARYAATRAEQLGIWADLQKRRAEFDKLRQRARMSSADAEAVRLALETTGDYVGVGRLGVSTIYDGSSLPELFRLKDAGTGRTIAYLRPTDGFDMQGMLDQIIGIVGTKSYDPGLRLNLIAPRRIDLLTRAPISEE